MKKLLAIFMVLVMVLSFAACGTKGDDIRGEQTGGESSEAEFSLGSASGLTYESEFIGIGCKLDEGWTFYTDAQIKELNDVTEDLAGEEYAEAMKNANVVYDMYALGSNQADSVSVNLEKVNSVQLLTLDIKKNFETIYPSLKSTLENIGCTDISYEMGKVTIGDKEFDCMDISSQANGVKLYQKLVAKKCNGYLANITITTVNEDNTDDVIAKFYLVK